MTDPEVTRLADTSESWDGAQLPAYPAGTPRVTVLRGVIPPGAKMAMHRRAVLNAGVMLRGEPTVISETGAERTFRAGEALVELVGIPHCGENRGFGAAEVVMFYAGAGNLPLSQSVE